MLRRLNIQEVLATHRIVVCVGPGGVGKTTTAAALGVIAARQGRRVLTLTVDPAKRLAASLGLPEVGSTLTQVNLNTIAHSLLDPPSDGGELWVMMLDTKATFDALVEKHASSSEVKQRILQNRIYQYVSTSLAGTQSYMAMEKLHALSQDSNWDLIVLDTPPSANGLDVLDAPERLIVALDSPATTWIREAFRNSGRGSVGLLGRGSALVLRALSRITGTDFLRSVADFIADLNALFGGFRVRAQEVARTIRSESTAFVVVTVPETRPLFDAKAWLQRLSERGLQCVGMVINRVPPQLDARVLPQDVQDAAQVLSQVASLHGADATRRLVQAFSDALAQSRVSEGLLHGLDNQMPVRVVPQFIVSSEGMQELGLVVKSLSST